MQEIESMHEQLSIALDRNYGLSTNDVILTFWDFPCSLFFTADLSEAAEPPRAGRNDVAQVEEHGGEVARDDL